MEWVGDTERKMPLEMCIAMSTNSTLELNKYLV
jgi:hypothetical protein